MSVASRLALAWNALSKGTSLDYIHASLPPGAASFTKIKTENRITEFRDAVEKYYSWVYVCAGRNASAVAQTPLELFYLPEIATPAERLGMRRYKRNGVLSKRVNELRSVPWLQAKQRKALDEVEEVTEHPFLDLMSKVNPYENGFEMFEKLVLYLELTGNSFLYLAKNEQGTPVEIWHLMPQWTKVVPDPETFIKEYRYGPIEPRQIFQTKDVVHFKYPNPKDLYLGWGPLQAAVDAVSTSTFYHRYEQTLLENYARPDFILSTEMPVTQVQIDSIKTQWNKLFRGARNQGKVAVLEAGLKPVIFNFSPREMAFLQGRQISRDEIAAAFGVPKSLIETKDVNRANADTGEYVYAKYTILPRIRRIEQKLNEAIIWPYWGPQYFAAFCNPVAEDKEYRLKEITAHLATGYTSINEERQVDNLDECEWGEGDPRPKAPVPGEAPEETPPKPEGGAGNDEENLPEAEPEKAFVKSLEGNGHHRQRVVVLD